MKWLHVCEGGCRWQDVKEDGGVWIPANYAWCLELLGDHHAGWVTVSAACLLLATVAEGRVAQIDFVSHLQRPEEIGKIVSLMGWVAP